MPPTYFRTLHLPKRIRETFLRSRPPAIEELDDSVSARPVKSIASPVRINNIPNKVSYSSRITAPDEEQKFTKLESDAG